MIGRRIAASLLSLLLVIGMVPQAALAEGVEEVQTLRAAVEYRVNANDDEAPWVSFASWREALEAARLADEQRAQQEAASEDAPAQESQNPEGAPVSTEESTKAEGTDNKKAEEVAQDQGTAKDQGTTNGESNANAEDQVANEDTANKTSDANANQGNEGQVPVQGNETQDPEPASTQGQGNETQVPEQGNEAQTPESAPTEQTKDATPLEIRKLEVRVANAQGNVELRTRAGEEEWPEEWPEAQKSQDESQEGEQSEPAQAKEAFADLQLRVNDDLAKTHDVWYRVHVGDAWLGWVKNGEAAAPNNKEALVNNMQVLLLTKDESKEFVATEFGTKEAPADDQNQTNETPQDEVDEKPVQVMSASSDEQKTTEDTKDNKTAKKEADDKSDQLKIESVSIPQVSYRVHAQDYGWLKWVSNGELGGTTGKGKRLEGINIKLPAGTNGGIAYTVHAQDYGWMREVSNGAVGGTVGKGKRLEGIKIRLTGEVAKKFDVCYRVHAQDYGWLKWVRNGQLGGTTGKGKRLEAIQIILVPKGGETPTSIQGSDPAVKTGITYRASVYGLGWLGWMDNGDVAGITGVSAVANGFSAKLAGLSNSELHYSAHVQNVGWQNEVTGGNTVGTPSKNNRIEAITMRLSGTAQANYDIYYRCHVSDYGWLNWAKNGQKAGSSGFGKSVEAIQVRLVKKGAAAPSGSSYKFAYIDIPVLRYRGHVQNIGWQGWVGNGGTAGTSGRGLRVEALQATVSSDHSGGIQIKTHVQNIGWQGWVGNGATAGTSGRGLRVEALCVRLTGELAKDYDVWYRVHAQNIGWMGWTKNGAESGTAGMGMRLEAIQLAVTAKGGAAPGSTNRPFINAANVSKMGYQNPSGYYQVSSKNVKITSAARAPWNYVTKSRISIWASRNDCVNAFVSRAYEYMGSPYMWNYSCAPGVGVDCIGLVYQCAYACGIDLGGGTDYDDFNPWAHYVTGNSGWHSHDAENFWNYGRALHVPLEARQRGDVISYPGHAAVYVGNDTVVEAIMGAGVVQRNMYASGSPRGVIRLFH